MRILIFGGNGMLGHKLVQVLSEKLEVWTTIRGEFSGVERFGVFDRDRTIESVEVTDLERVRRAIETATPDVVINAVGIIKQLPTSNNVVKTLLINSIFPHQLAGISEEFGFRLICISTDCVFDGRKGNYTEQDDANALDLYGRSKYLGEVSSANCLTLRTSIIGRELNTNHSLVEWFLSKRAEMVNGFVNAIYSGFPTIVFADIITDLILHHSDLNGLFHVSSEQISKFRLLTLINEYFKANSKIEPFADFTIDRRLDSTRFRTATGFKPQTWEKMIERMAADATQYDKWRQ